MNHTLLIVDDELTIRQGLSSFHWEELGFKAVAALEDGKQALEYVLSHPVDVVLCDIRMPSMDGLAFAKEVWERKLPVTVVLCQPAGKMSFEKFLGNWKSCSLT